jgi:hypothetical protein
MTAKTREEQQENYAKRLRTAAKKKHKIMPKAANQMVVHRPMSDEQAFVALIDRAARDPEFDVQKFQILMNARAADKAQRQREAFAKAMSEVQEKLEPVRRDCENRQTRSRYASYEALDRAIRPTYTQHGFALSFSTDPSPTPDSMRVICEVSHRDGAYRQHQIDIPIVTKGPQGKEVMTATHAAMSAKTYGMRGLLTMIFNVALTDDDGNAAGNGGPVSDAQLLELQELLQQKPPINEKSFCAYMGTDELINLPAKKFAEAKDAIADKRKGMETL